MDAGLSLLADVNTRIFIDSVVVQIRAVLSV